MSTWWRRLRYVLALIGLTAIATCPTAKRACVAKQRAKEATELLEYLGDRVADAVTATGQVPPLAAGPTPQPACCEQGGACTPDAKLWDAPGWRALGFSIDTPFRFTYEYAPDASGASAIARATADLDCDGHRLTVELQLRVVNGKLERSWTRKTASE